MAECPVQGTETAPVTGEGPAQREDSVSLADQEQRNKEDLSYNSGEETLLLVREEERVR